jgi:transcriptional regulator with PAS, ATPase and Fis domain
MRGALWNSSSMTIADQDRRVRRFEQIVGDSAALKVVLEQAQRVATVDSTVLIQGETGTGKELIAHAIHNASPRSGHALIKVNCAAIPFELERVSKIGSASRQVLMCEAG